MKTIYRRMLGAGLGVVLGTLVCTAGYAESNAPAYLIAEVQVTDAAGYAAYVARLQATLDPFGGRAIARGGAQDLLEGAPFAGRVAVFQFPSLDKARQFWNSPAYRELVPIRQKASTGRIYIVEGLPQ